MIVWSKRKSEQLKHLCKRLHNNPLLIKWYVLAVAAGHTPADLINKEGLSFKEALRFCFENLYDKLGEVESKVVSVITCLRKPVSAVELRFFSMGKLRLRSKKRFINYITQACSSLGQMRMMEKAGYILIWLGSPRNIWAALDLFLKKHIRWSSLKEKGFQNILDSTNVMQHHYNYDLNTISWSTRDEKICAIYLKKALSDHKEP